MNPATPEGIELEFIGSGLVDGQPSASWLLLERAIARGFHESSADADGRKILAELDEQDEVQSILAFDRTAAAPSLHAADPVGTYSYFAGTLNVGGPQLLEVHEITSVTVSPTHRRRGILRSMITTHLDRAAADGVPVAVLTASEATIYGRFGFGVAAERCRFELKSGQGAQFRAPASGTVQAVAPSAMAEQVAQLYREHHLATLGSVSNNSFDLGRATGRWESYDNLKPAAKLRGALHYDAHGTLDGFITYTFEGWKQEEPAMSIGTLCTVNETARRELVAYLCDHDLIERVTGRGPVDDVLPTALRNARDYKTTARGDHLWVRILDVPAALGARSYQRDARVVLQVDDDLGYAAGTWVLETAGGVMSVQRADGAAADARLDARDLATLYLGTRSATHLAGAGLLAEHRAGALDDLDAMFTGPRTPYCQADF